ncbi:MAG: hypothetical protein KGJ23_07945 [Euryarchaeota archaeon]|nr:hypothetical protein [Euryarchaeota archaeon]MDE1836532.1 hypothetical protein [Euryarchaeota archaeon]MDE1879273.1 hypothetical protein [Euryarchaeota archaeon]MDE2044502.1 hypothetical protein [Thermoplasmata archaeon]
MSGAPTSESNPTPESMPVRWVIFEHTDTRRIGCTSGTIEKKVFETFTDEQGAVTRYGELRAVSRFAGSAATYWGYPVKVEGPLPADEREKFRYMDADREFEDCAGEGVEDE